VLCALEDEGGAARLAKLYLRRVRAFYILKRRVF